MTILCPLKRLPQIAFGVQLGGVGATPAKLQVEESIQVLLYDRVKVSESEINISPIFLQMKLSSPNS